MDIFNNFSQSEKLGLDNWLAAVKNELNKKVEMQSEHYGFDFFEEIPYKSNSRFSWEKICTNSKILSNCMSSICSNTTDEIEEIPLELEDFNIL